MNKKREGNGGESNTFVSCPEAENPKVSTTVIQYHLGFEASNLFRITYGVSIVVIVLTPIVSPSNESTADN